MAPLHPGRPLAPLNPNLPHRKRHRNCLFLHSTKCKKDPDPLRHGGATAGQYSTHSRDSNGSGQRAGYGEDSHACERAYCRNPDSEAQSTLSRSDGCPRPAANEFLWSKNYTNSVSPNFGSLTQDSNHGALSHKIPRRAQALDFGGLYHKDPQHKDINEGFDHEGPNYDHESPNYHGTAAAQGFHLRGLYKWSLNYQHEVKGLYHGGIYCKSSSCEDGDVGSIALLSPLSSFDQIAQSCVVTEYLHVQLLHSLTYRSHTGTATPVGTCFEEDSTIQQSTNNLSDIGDNPHIWKEVEVKYSNGWREVSEKYDRPPNLLPLKIPSRGAKGPYLDDVIDSAWHYNNVGEPLSPYTRLTLRKHFSISLPTNSPSSTWKKWFNCLED